MRTLTFALLTTLALNAVAGAQAADLDYGVLRGPDYEQEAPLIDWNGVYFGGHGGYTSASAGFKNAYKPLITDIVRYSTAEAEFNASSMLIPRSRSVDGASYGAFAGFNYQFDETVVGIEVDYTRFDKSNLTADNISRFRVNSQGFLETVSLSGSATSRVEDYGTIRARGGYAIGNFLPFVTAGLAIGRVHVDERVRVSDYGYDQATYRANQQLTTGNPSAVKNFGYTRFDPNNPESGTPSSVTGQNVRTKVMGGFTLGAGLEFAVTQNIILRGEYQYVMFNDFEKNGGNRTAMNTVRGGAAVKF